jgi:hypothetical protein
MRADIRAFVRLNEGIHHMQTVFKGFYPREEIAHNPWWFKGQRLTGRFGKV